MRSGWAALIALVVCSGVASAQNSAPLDGPGRPFQDSLIDRLAGNWTMSGNVGKAPANYNVHAEWVLNHQFLRLEMNDAAADGYHAHVYIGRDNTSDRYVAHWLDIFGGRWSETLGYGTRNGNALDFLFEYPDGPFHTTFLLGPSGNWHVTMRQKTASGEWKVFADYRMKRE